LKKDAMEAEGMAQEGAEQPCPRCGRPVADGAVYCPHCCGAPRLRGNTRHIMRAGLRGGAFGLFLGALCAVVLLWFWGDVRGTRGIAFGCVVTFFATGLLLGLTRGRGWR